MNVLLVRADGTPDEDADALRARGFDVTAEPFIVVAASRDPDAPARARRLLDAIAGPDAWLIATSAAGLRALYRLAGPDTVSAAVHAAASVGTRFAAVGPASAHALRQAGAQEVLVPEAGHTASALLAALRAFAPATAVLPRSSVGDHLLPRTLAARGWSIAAEVVYDTRPTEERPRAAGPLAQGAFDALVLRSPSAARAVARHAGRIPPRTKVVAGGPTTALAARRLGMDVAAVAADSRAASIAASVARALGGEEGP